MSDGTPGPKRRLAAERSQASTSPLGEHDDALSPVEALRESVGTTGGPRLGDGIPVDGPIVSLPDDHRPLEDDESERHGPRHLSPRGHRRFS
jgi:hypothetical protein